MVADSNTAEEVSVALAGFGTVGSAVVRLLQEESSRLHRQLGIRCRLKTILDRSYRTKDLGWVGPDIRLTDSVEDFLADRSDIVVELLGGTDPADEIIRQSLKRGKAVVTANKFLFARSGSRYIELAVKHHAFLGCEASVAGGIPILRALRQSLLGDRILTIRGILNGTCNFILSEMEESGKDFGESLKQAQERGYAEADPTLDISGQDAADKLTILGALSFGRWVPPDEIPTRGISEIDMIDFTYARRFHSTIRLLAVAERRNGTLTMRVGPFLIDNRLPLSKLKGVLNGVEVTGARLGSTLFSGPGAGGDPTAVSVVSDILDASLWRKGAAAFRYPSSTVDSDGSDQPTNGTDSYPFYIRFFVQNQPGVVARLTEILARHEINVDSVLQESGAENSEHSFVVSVESTPYSRLLRALADLGKPDFNRAPPLALPILRA